MAFSRILLEVQKNHNSSKSIIDFFESSILQTAFSQYGVGKVETLTSILFQSSHFREYFQS
jgi:hypothetical protein